MSGRGAYKVITVLALSPLIATVLVLGAPPVPARAGDAPVLVGSSPGEGDRLTAAPLQVSVAFDQPPDPTIRMSVTGPGGTVASGQALLLGLVAVQSLPTGLPNGDYVVRYVATFGSSGELRGTVRFTLRDPAARSARRARAAPRSASAPPSARARVASDDQQGTSPAPSAGASRSAGAFQPAGVYPGGRPELAARTSPHRRTGLPWVPLGVGGVLLLAAAAGADHWRNARRGRTVRSDTADSPPAA